MYSTKIFLALYYIYLTTLRFCYTQETTSEKGNTGHGTPIATTQTVYGFLDFTTTISNTVMVFSPQSAATTSSTLTTPLVIKESPQTESSVHEILPSKPTSYSTSKNIDNSENLNLTSTSFLTSSSASTYNDKQKKTSLPPTKSTTKSLITSAQNTTNIKNKTIKISPKSLPVSTTSSKPTTKDKIKSLQKPGANTHKNDSTTESSSHSQIASTKKTLEKKSPIKLESTTKAPIKPKTDKTSKPNLVLGNSTIKNKTTVKTEKPKITAKMTSQSTSPVFKSPEKLENNLTVIASKVEVREEPTNLQRLNKPEMEVTEVNHSVFSSSIQINSTSQSVHLPTTSSIEEEEPGIKELTTIFSTTEEPAIISSGGISAPGYDFLSRQPSEIIDETFKVIDVKSNSNKNQKPKISNNYRSTTPADIYEETQPLGLITSLSDSIVKDGLTTIYETNVIGTHISGKYAQVLQSNSHVQQNPKKIKPSSTIRILKTVPPLTKSTRIVPGLEPTPTYDEDASSAPVDVLYNQEQGIKPSRKPSLGSNTYSKSKYSTKNKLKEDYRDDYGTTAAEEEEIVDTDYTSGSSSTPLSHQYSTSSSKKLTTKKGNHNSRPFKLQNNRFSKPTTPELATVSVFSENQASITPSYSNGRRFTPSSRRSTKPATSTESEKTFLVTKRSYKSKIGPSNVENNHVNSLVTPSTYKFKLSRPSGRWQYKTSPKPRVTIRRQDEIPDNVTANPIPQFTPDIQLEGTDQELSGSGIYTALQHEDNSIVHEVTPSLVAETLRVEISTPADFKDLYYEIATIKSPYTFQVGSVKNTRFITVTSTFEKSLVQPTESPTPSRTEPLSENILVSTHNAYDKEPPLDSSIATLPPIGLAGDAETPPLETITESFSTTQLMLKTHILPVVRGGSDTTSYTLVQSYHVTRLVTATKTLPPMEVYQFVPSKTLNEFNTRLDEAGSEVHLELEFGDNNEHDDEPRPNIAKALLSDLDVTNVGSDFDIADVDKNKILEQHLRSKKAHKSTTTSTTNTTPLSLAHTTETIPTTPALSPEQLQQLALLRLLNPNAALPNLITSSKPIIKVETIYETHILPIFNGGSTFFTTISRPTATHTRTEYEFVTNTMPTMQSSVFNPLFPQPSFQIATTPLVTQTMVTATESKVLKLNFGAKTSYTTLFSTKVTPTILTTYVTNSIPVQPTIAPFGGFFNPAPYGFNAPFPFVG